MLAALVSVCFRRLFCIGYCLLGARGSPQFEVSAHRGSKESKRTISIRIAIGAWDSSTVHFRGPVIRGFTVHNDIILLYNTCRCGRRWLYNIIHIARSYKSNGLFFPSPVHPSQEYTQCTCSVDVTHKETMSHEDTLYNIVIIPSLGVLSFSIPSESSHVNVPVDSTYGSASMYFDMARDLSFSSLRY